MKKTGVVFFPAFDWAITPTHPEREERLLYTRDQLFEEGIMDFPQIIEYKPRLATLKDIARVHFCVPDISAQTTEAHLISAGASLTLADAVLQKEIANGFSIARPPGHHAKTVVHGNRGFCNINNEAIMVEYVRHQYNLRKVAIVDTDVHHGDGSQEIFYNDPDVLFISFHQDGRTLYPGSGFIEELGTPRAWGTTINVPLPPGTTDEGILYVLDSLVLPLLKDFKPELIINSAGQDNHYTDPLADMCFSSRGYAQLNDKLKPDLCVLEGGYSVETALPYINMGILMAMAGIDYSNLREPDYKPDYSREKPRNMKIIREIVERQLDNYSRREYMQAQALEQRDGKHYAYEDYIYYDTDQISENQAVQINLCPDCPGYTLIDSTGRYRTGSQKRVFCISIPIFACAHCQHTAQNLYKEMAENSAKFELIYLQDKSADIFASTDAKTKQETCY